MNLKSAKYGDFSQLEDLFHIMASEHVVITFDADHGANFINVSSLERKGAYKFVMMGGKSNQPAYFEVHKEKSEG